MSFNHNEHGYGAIHVSAANREIASRWLAEGTRPLTDRIGCIAVWFDGLTLRLTLDVFEVSRGIPKKLRLGIERAKTRGGRR